MRHAPGAQYSRLALRVTTTLLTTLPARFRPTGRACGKLVTAFPPPRGLREQSACACYRPATHGEHSEKRRLGDRTRMPVSSSALPSPFQIPARGVVESAPHLS